LTDFVRHRRELFVALFDAGQLALLDGVVKKDLDVDLVVGGIDASGVVDGVGVDVTVAQRELDAAALREAEVGSLADDAYAKLVGVDADCIVGAVARGGMIFVA